MKTASRTYNVYQANSLKVSLAMPASSFVGMTQAWAGEPQGVPGRRTHLRPPLGPPQAAPRPPVGQVRLLAEGHP